MAQISDRPITPAQVRAIHVALSARGIDDDTYRERLERAYGVRTCKDLTRRQASELLRGLGQRLAQPPGSRPAPHRAAAPSPSRPADVPYRRRAVAPGVTRLPSPAQRRLIAELSREVDWREADGYTRWLEKNMGLARVASADHARRVIEGLKAIRRRQQRSADGPA